MLPVQITAMSCTARIRAPRRSRTEDGSVVLTRGGSENVDAVQVDGVVPDKDQVLRNPRAIESDAAGADGRHAAADLREGDEESGRSDCPHVARHAVALAPIRVAKAPESGGCARINCD